MNTRTAAHWIRAVFALLAAALIIAWGANTAHADEAAASLSIASNGQIIAKSAEVVSVSGSQIVARTGWGAASIQWVLQTSGSTRFVPEVGSEAALRGIQSGDTIAFTGTIIESYAKPTVSATVIRNESLVQRSVSVLGTVMSVEPEQGRFTVGSNGTVTEIEVYGGTLMSRNGGYMHISDIAVGESAKAIGSLSTADSVLRAERVWVKTPEPVEETVSLPASEAIDQSVGTETGVIAAILNWLRGSRGMLSVRDR